METVGPRVDEPVDYISREHMSGVRVWVAEEKGEGHCWKGVVVGKSILEKLHCCRERKEGRKEME